MVKEANRFVPFFNAAIQGASKTIRSFKNDKLGFTARAMMAATIPSLIQDMFYLFFADDDDREEFLEIPQYERDKYWFFKIGKTWAKLPKPFSIGLAFGTIPEMIIEDIYKAAKGKKNEKALSQLKEVLFSLFDSFTPVQNIGTVIPPLLKAGIEAKSNHSFFTGRNLYPEYMKRMPAYMRYTKNTSNAAKLIGKVGISPAIIDNTIRTLGGTAATDFVSIFGNGKSGYPKDIADKIGFAGITARKPTGNNSRSVNTFYKEYGDAQKLYNEWNAIKKENTKYGAEFFRKNKKEIQNYNKLKNTYNIITAKRKLIETVANSKLSDKDKRERIEKLESSMTKAAREILIKQNNPIAKTS
jgi:hypothetical protein